ncbi:hypothetical protein AB4Z10_14245 [Bosea sp. RAF48]|uniref:hypothetical protein n=1 Tax=Bosea sp. RAF48 TaxID=3237480 RepID=UPI003F8F9D1A
MLKLFVHGLGAWFAVEAASGRYPRPIAVGLTMLVSRLGAPATLLAVAGYGLERLREAGAFEGRPARPRQRHARPAVSARRGARPARGARDSSQQTKA